MLDYRCGILVPCVAVVCVDLGLKLSQATFETVNFGVEECADVWMLQGSANRLVKQLLRVSTWEQETEVVHIATQLVLPFDERDLIALIGQFQRGVHAG